MLVFRLPGDSDFLTVSPRPGSEQSVAFTTFEGKESLRFQGDFMRATADTFEQLEREFRDFPATLSVKADSQAEYEKKILQAKDFLQETGAEKIVLSRRKVVDLPADFSLAKSVQQMATAYPAAFVYALVTNEECWMGGFSEILGKYDGASQLFHTVSLAGTLPLKEEWTEKEFREQESVSRYLRQILEKNSEMVQESSLQELISGNIKHLKTDFTSRMEEADVSTLIQALHPTPAVCGMPKDLCQGEICRLEAQPRGLYAGYITIREGNSLTAFVNLRCAQFTRKEAAVCVGGGLNSQSLPKKEWRETELKSRAILDSLATF